MKKLALSLLAGIIPLLNFAQVDVHSEPELPLIHTCGTDHAQEKLFLENPSIKAAYELEQAEFQLEYEDFLSSWSPGDRSTYVVPMVVHVVHLGGPENISNEQIYNAVEQLNLDFSASNTDIGLTIPEFAGIIGDCDIEFRLATKDPSGACHPGITRTYSSTTYDTGLSSGVHPIVEAVRDVHGNWPQNKYMNVFVCIDPNGNAGYTYNPGGWYSASGMLGSIMMRHDYMGIIGTSSVGRKHTLAHEVGHWLNLSHPWGGSNTPGDPDNCALGDGVADTPNTIGWNNCSDVYGATCGSLDNVQNIMDYSYCSTMFTEGQAARVQTSLTGLTAQRYKLFTPSNLSATGTNGPGELCEANFASNTVTICEGESISFTDLSFHTVTSRSWTFTGGSPATSTSENPTVTYNTPGTYSVTLTAFNGGDSSTENKINYITVLPNTGSALPYSEGFESLLSLPDGERFTLENTGDDVTWTITSAAFSQGTKSAFLSNYGAVGGSKDGLLSGTIDLSTVNPDDDIVFNFKYAYKKQDSDNDEWIRFFISKDCGETWALRKNIHGDELSEEITGSPYTPAEFSEWKQVNITNIFDDYYVSNFRFKIEFEGDNGNNVYIDDINLYPASMASIVENNKLPNLTVYPNPIREITTVEFFAPENEFYDVTLYNAIGEKVITIFSGEVPNGNNKIQFNTESVATGVYFLKITNGNNAETVKLIKN